MHDLFAIPGPLCVTSVRPVLGYDIRVPTLSVRQATPNGIQIQRS